MPLWKMTTGRGVQLHVGNSFFSFVVSADDTGSTSEWLSPPIILNLTVCPVATSVTMNTSFRLMRYLPSRNQSTSLPTRLAEELSPGVTAKFLGA